MSGDSKETEDKSKKLRLHPKGSVPASLGQGWIFKTLETICIQLHSSYRNFKTVGHSPLMLVY